MFKACYSVLGVMSGTSLDGIDIAYIQFKYTNSWQFEILNGETIPYDSLWVSKLKNAIAYSEDQLDILNIDYTKYLANAITTFINSHQIEDLDFVSSHGHTIKHEPQNKYTLQIGNLPHLATLLNKKVVCDFRIEDVLLGGQGAPLVPIGDQLLFSEFDYCLNLGGFSNISFQKGPNRIAFDISPVNTVLNFYANKLGLDYDDKGIQAKNGSLDEALFNSLNELSYYKLPFPKSLGVEFINEIIFPLLESSSNSINDILHTFVEHIAFQISKAITNKNSSLLITGGGAYNEYLITRIKFYLPHCTVIVPASKIIEFKEALIFAFLGVLKLRNEINVLASVTGASKNHSSGKVYLP